MNRFPEDDRNAATTEDEHEKASSDEPSDVSEKGYSPAGSADCSCAAYQLEEEPETEEDHRGDTNQPDEEEDGDKGEDA